MGSHGKIGKLPVITFIVLLGAFAAIAAVLYHNTLLEGRLSEVDAGVSKLTATVDRLMHSLETAREDIRQKDETIEGLQQEINGREQLKNGMAAAEQAKIASLISNLQPKIDPVVADTIAGAVHKYSRKYGIPPELIVSVAMRESSFRLILESNKKARGLMQIMASAHPEKIEKLSVNNNSIFHIDNNVHLGTMILAEYYEARNSIYGALEAYVGAELKNYINDILVGFADLKIQQFRSLPAEEPEQAERDVPGPEEGSEEFQGDETDEKPGEAEKFRRGE